MGYEKLCRDLADLLEKGRQRAVQAINEVLLDTYWNVGARLHGETGSFDRGEVSTFVDRLSNDLGVGSTVLWDALKFYRVYPDGLPDDLDFKRLSWGAHTVLLPVSEPDERGFYTRLAIEEGWSREKLRRAIRSNLYHRAKSNTPAGQAGEKLDRPERDLHNYAGIVERVIDGDTLKVRIDLGFDVWRVEKIRLRGIDTPELGTPGGVKAKRFVEETLKASPFVVLRTYKTDRYSRYVADLFYDPALKTKNAVFTKGRFLNQELLEQGLAVLSM